MATRMGGAEVEVVLNTAKAERQVSDLEARLKKMLADAEKLRRQVGAGAAPVSGGSAAASGGGTSGGPSDTKNVANQVVQQVKQAASGGKFASAVVSGVAGGSVQSIPGRIAGSMESALPGTTLKVAGAAALGYAAASTVAKASPIALEAIRAALPEALANSPAFKAIEGALEGLRNGFTTLESGVKAIFTGGMKTADLAAASMRVTGQIPALAPIFDQNVKVDTAEDRLRKKFDEFKAKEVAGAVGRAMGEVFKESLSR